MPRSAERSSRRNPDAAGERGRLTRAYAPIIAGKRHTTFGRAMAENTGRTLVCSVLFLDIVGYSKQSVADQHRVKQAFNDTLARELASTPQRERVILDTGDGVAIAFFGDPENALNI